MNNEGLVGGCECDVRSTATMVACTTLTQGRPGYISDPVIDTSSGRSSTPTAWPRTRPSGRRAGQPLPDSDALGRPPGRLGPLVPAGGLHDHDAGDLPDRKEILFHQAKAVANDPDDRACRTKLCAEPVGDIEKLFTQWDRWGWHRVTFYGDLKEPVFALADAIGWKVVEEA